MRESFVQVLAFKILPMRIDYEQAEFGFTPHIQSHAGCGKDLHEIGLATSCSSEYTHMMIHVLAMQSNRNILH